MRARDAIVSALDQAAIACERRKRAKPAAVRFRAHYTEELLGLSQRLLEGRYAPQPGTVLVSSYPKHREVHAAAYRDRVVHHLLHDLLEPVFERSFIADSFACRKGKGTHAAADRLALALREASRQGQRRAHYLQLDIRNFFVSIHRPTLLRLLRAGLARAARSGHRPAVPPGLDLDRLLEVLVLHDASLGARRVGPPGDFAAVPPHKRLGARGPEHGLPIGNLTSQFFANIYLNPLDQFVKRTLGARHYLRYVDDFVLVHESAEVLERWRERITAFLGERLGLALHQRPVRTVASGVDFVGYVLRPGYRLVRRRVVRAMERRLAALEAALSPRTLPRGSARRLEGLGIVRGPLRYTAVEQAPLESLRATWASFLGHVIHADAHRLVARQWQAHPTSQRWLVWPAKASAPGRRLPLNRPAETLREQLWRLRRPLRRVALVAQVGCWAELPFDADALGLPPVERSRGKGRRRRSRCRRGVRWRALGPFIEKALRRGRSLAFALERDEPTGSVKQRELAWLIEPEQPVVSTRGARSAGRESCETPREAMHDARSERTVAMAMELVPEVRLRQPYLPGMEPPLSGNDVGEGAQR